MPVQGRNDFILAGAGTAEFEVRMTQLLWPGEESTPSDIVVIDNMTINLATYQITIDDKPVDLTLMEYSLLSFLATHPSRAYSRETLLHRVWGFEYCGGTRTVDVHIRRVRSKVGPQVASHIVTVRGVGYLSSSSRDGGSRPVSRLFRLLQALLRADGLGPPARSFQLCGVQRQ